MKLRFLCGCMTGNVESRENLKTMDAVEIDDEGMMMCAIHHRRLYGWRSMPQNGVGADYKFASCTPAEIEGFKVFGEIPQSFFKTVDLKPATVSDRRDNRDPLEMARERAAARNGSVKDAIPR